MTPIRAWIVSTPELRYLSRKYRISEYLLSALGVNDPKVLEQIAIANRLTVDREAYEAHSVASNKLAFFGRPEAVRFDTTTVKGREVVRVTLRFKTATVLWYLSKEEYGKMSPEEWLEKLRNYVYIVAEKVVVEQKKNDNKRPKQKLVFWRAEKVRFVNVNADTETAKKLIEAYSKRYSYPVATALMTLLGYHPEIENEPEAWLTILARLVPVVSPDPVHGVEFTVPGTGKTTTALIYETALQWKYYAEVPSLATLVGDARTGAAIIARVSGAWFDEFDAWVTDSKKRSEMRELIETLLTGMWQGRWQRSKGGIHSIVVDNPIPLWHSGNVVAPEHPRNKLVSIIKSIAPDKAEAYNDRIAIAMTVTKHKVAEAIQEWTLSNKSGKVVYGRPSVLKGAVELLQRKVAMEAVEPKTVPFKGRRAENYRRVYRALSVLLSKGVDKVEPDLDKVEKIAKLFVEGVIIQ